MFGTPKSSCVTALIKVYDSSLSPIKNLKITYLVILLEHFSRLKRGDKINIAGQTIAPQDTIKLSKFMVH